MTRVRGVVRSGIGLVLAVIFWCVLWGGFGLQEILGGLAVALLVNLVFPMPTTGHEVTIRPVQTLRFLLRFMWDLVLSAGEVAWYAVRPAGQPASSVIAVPLRSKSDLFLTGTGVLCTLIPGSVVVEAQRSTGTLFLHAFGADSDEQAEKARHDALEQERRLLMAFGSKQVLEEAGLL